MSLLNLMNLFISVCEIVKSGENVKSGDYCAKYENHIHSLGI